MIAAVMLHAHRFGPHSFFSPHGETKVVPLLVLSLMPWPFLVAYLLILTFMREIKGTKQIFPRLWMQEFETPRLSIAWEKISAAITLLLPFAGLVYFWLRFQRGEAWVRDSMRPVSPWHYVSPEYFLDWNAHRYGLRAANEAVSFVPFWLPLFMLIGTGLTVILAVLIVVQLPSRIKASRRRLWQQMP